MRPHQILSSTLELLDLPHKRIALGRIRNRPNRRLEFRRIRVLWNRHDNLHIVRRRPSLELRFSFDHKLYPRSRVGFDDGLAPNERFDLGVESVAHQLEFAVWWDEGNGSVRFESG